MQGSLQSAAEHPSERNSWIWTREGQFRPLGRVAFVEEGLGGQVERLLQIEGKGWEERGNPMSSMGGNRLKHTQS